MVGEERGGEDTGGGGRSFLSNIKFCRMKRGEGNRNKSKGFGKALALRWVSSLIIM